MRERELKARMKRAIAKAWLGDSPYRQAICIAYLDNGDLCRKPASYIDPTRGGMVCDEHKPKG